MSARPVILVKLGGSLITDKTRNAAARGATLRRLAEAIAEASGRTSGPRLLVGHGSGSFGHVAAAEGGLASGAPARRRRDAVSRTQHRAGELHRLVVGALEAAGARPFSLAPSSFLRARNGRVTGIFDPPLVEALAQGFLPVVYGDVVLDSARGATIVSTEALFLVLAESLARRRIDVRGAVWLGITRGVLDDRGATIPRLSAAEAARAARRVRGAAGVDVTGGMALRLAAAARLAGRGIASSIVDGRRPGAFAAAIRGRAPEGTRVDTR
ncbi:MAG TPA: isopentenyl phosphate kinase [Candidatus Polarisedimenticolaceae bacterium]|nr:isopentenyl phosphate kinase [Candidatus Polarisedimenticolaceae bacterium]